MEHYKITNPDDIYELKDPSTKDTLRTMMKIKTRIGKDPDIKHLVIYVAAGHGMNEDGQQVLLVNQFDKSRQFYKFFAIEKEIRTIARRFPKNSY